VFSDGTVSTWSSLTGLTLLGLSLPPGDVTNLHLRSVDGQTVLDWTVVDDPRILLITRSARARPGTPAWSSATTVAQPPWAVTGDGTYHVRAYVLSPFGDAHL
jgi:hypothetical protein